MEAGQWLSLWLVCLLGAMSPGPSLAVVLDWTRRRGLPAGLAAALAHGLGVALYGLLTVTGLALLITRSPPLFAGVQILGALYLLYLGLRALGASGSAAPADPQSPVPARDRRGAALSGFLVAFLNPKLAVFMLALFSQFLSPGAPWPLKAVMVTTVGITDAAWYSLVAVLSSRSRVLAWLEHNAILVDRLLGLLLLVLGAAVLLRVALAL
ncbi:MAG: LysE family translocator [Parahaliea sp.]